MKKFFCIAGMLVGVAFLIVGIYMLTGVGESFSYSRTPDYQFGADYYTEQYAATRNASDNIVSVGKLLSREFETGMQVLGLVVMCFGAGVICYFGCKISEKSGTVKRDDSYAYLENVGMHVNSGAIGMQSFTEQDSRTIVGERPQI